MKFLHFIELLLAYMLVSATLEATAQPVEVIDTDQLMQIIDQQSPKVKVISFWATWCKPCVEEIPYLEEMQMSGKAEVILVSLDFMNELDSIVYRFVAQHELTSRVCIIDNVDYNSWINKVDKSWTGAIPATLIINSISGKRKFIEQALKEDDLERALNEIKN